MPKASQDYNLYILKPHLIMEWHPTKNGDLRPRDITPGSGKKVWWLCEEGHEWQAAIYSRSRGSGCPHCHRGSPSTILDAHSGKPVTQRGSIHGPVAWIQIW